MKEKKQATKEKEIEAPEGVERFTVELSPKQAEKYPLLSRHEFNGTAYKVSFVMTGYNENIAIQFVRVS